MNCARSSMALKLAPGRDGLRDTTSNVSGDGPEIGGLVCAEANATVSANAMQVGFRFMVPIFPAIVYLIMLTLDKAAGSHGSAGESTEASDAQNAKRDPSTGPAQKSKRLR